MKGMSDDRKGGSGGPDSDFFTVGPPLHAVRGGYVRRPADDALYRAVVAGKHAHVIAPARTGKTSLIAATTARLQNNGFKVAKLDLAQITERDGGTDAGRWYYSIAYRLMRQLRLKIDLQEWWQDKAILSNRQRLVEFYIEVILQNIRESIVVFIDEIQSIEKLPFSEHLLPSVRAAHNARATDPDFQRLIFVLAGEVDTTSLISDPGLSPFSVSQNIPLGDFTRRDIDLFASELNLPPADAATALDRIYHWTGGQPYLTQKLARATARERPSGDIDGHIDRIAVKQLAGRAALHSEPHMSHIHQRIVNDRKDYEALLNVYGRLRKGIPVPHDPESRLHRKLQVIGLVVVDPDGQLAVRNELYEAVFTARWANTYLPLHWRGPAIAAALIVLLMAIPFWYTQLLPKPYMRALVSPTLALESVHDAWRNLRSFPGHVETADRLYQNLLRNRASLARERAVITDIATYARDLPGAAAFAEDLIAGFWDRRAQDAMRVEDRDSALMAALQSLVVSTTERRRIAASLVGDDYPQLIATLPPKPAERIYFNSRDMLLSLVNNAVVSQWALVNEQVQAREPWTVSALEVTPLVRRVVVDRNATVTRIGLSVNVSHARLDDLRLKLIAPSGRTVELLPEGKSSSVNDVNNFSQAQLAPLKGEPISGTWTISVRDEATGINGHLHGWNLNLNSQVVVETFERGLDIPAPVERESDNIWFSDDGRYAIARAQQSDNARLWDLASARPARSIAVPASERVLGLAVDARFLVTVAQDAVHMWSTGTGRREAVLDAAVGGADVQLSSDGRHVLVSRRGATETSFGLWSLEEQKRVATMSVAGAPAMVAINGSVTRIAIADYDRAVRIWNMRTGQQEAQLDLHALATGIQLSPDGDALAVVHGDQGISLWRTEQPATPLLVEQGDDRWQLRFSPSGDLLVAGSSRRGYQLYRVSDGAIAGPPLHAGFAATSDALLAFSVDEQTLLSAAAGDRARFWELPATTPGTDSSEAGGSPAHRIWRKSGDSLVAIAPGGGRLAIGDSDGHVHVLNADANAAEIAAASDDVNYMGHQGAVIELMFNDDGTRIASAGADGTIRIWDAESGLPQPGYTDIGNSNVTEMQFSPAGLNLAVLGGQRVWLIDAAAGAIVADRDLGEPHGAMAFGNDRQLYLGAESGTLRSMAADRVGTWNLRSVWQGEQPLRRIDAAAARPLLVVVNATNTAQILDMQNGRMGPATLQLADAVSEVLFTESGTRVLIRTARWIHRAAVSSAGLSWLDAIRSPTPLTGSQMVFDRVDQPGEGGRRLDTVGDRVLMLTRDAGFAEIARLSFEYDAGPLLFGGQDELLATWHRRLAMPAEPGLAEVVVQ